MTENTPRPPLISAPSRRAFLGGALAGLGGGVLAGRYLWPDPPPSPPSTEPDTLFLTWQRDPTTTMTVQWVGPQREDSKAVVYYSDAGSGNWENQSATIKPYPSSSLKVHRAELSDLQPGKLYRFRVGNKGPEYGFRTMPAKATDRIAFISGGDCGVNPHTIANNQQAARQDPHFAVIGGDIAYDDGFSAETNLAFLRNYSQHMIGPDNRMIPLVPCIGNHEVLGGYKQPRSKAPFFYALFDGLFPETGYTTLDFGDYLSLVLLDTGHTSPIGGEQTDWLEKTLKARADHPHVFIVNHVPAYPSFRPMKGGGEDNGESNRKHWVPLFEKYRVPVVLEHHDHTFKRTWPLIGGLAHDNGVLYVGDGSWGQLRIPQKSEELPFLAACSGEYHLSLHQIEGEERVHLALGETGRVMDVSRSGQRKEGRVRAS